MPNRPARTILWNILRACPSLTCSPTWKATHHVVERKLWAEIDTDLNKILLVHYAHHGVMLTKLHHLFGLLRTDLEEHFAREEKLVFPLMRTYPRPNLEILNLVQNLITDHTQAGDVIKEIEVLTDHFTAPADACPRSNGPMLCWKNCSTTSSSTSSKRTPLSSRNMKKKQAKGNWMPRWKNPCNRNRVAGTMNAATVPGKKTAKPRARCCSNAATAVPCTATTAAKPAAHLWRSLQPRPSHRVFGKQLES
jgi:hypothetical protein